MSALFAQKAITGFAALTVAAAGTALPGSDAKAAPLIFDCYSRSTSDLLMKSALDLSNENLACVQNGVGAQVSYVPAAPQQVYVAPAPAPAPAPSAGESFFGSMLGSAIGGVLGNAINGGNRTTEVHHHYDRGQNQVQDTMWRPENGAQKPSRKVMLPGGIIPKVNVINPNLRKPIQLPGASGGASAGKDSGVVIPNGTTIGGLKPPSGKPGFGKPGSGLPF
jgi:hypothetical protein